jgi:putative sterol carrier protein
MADKPCIFLSQEWVRRVVAAIERAKLTDVNVRETVSEFTLSVAYVVTGLPDQLRQNYGGDKATIYVRLDHGTTKQFTIGDEAPAGEKPDFTVESDYEVARKIFQGELTAASAFVKRLVRVRPLTKLYANPAFTAKSLMTFNLLLKVMARVPTIYPTRVEEAAPKAGT